MADERYELAIGRIREIRDEKIIAEEYQEYFHTVAGFLLQIDEVRTSLMDGSYDALDLKEVGELNQSLYRDVLPENYAHSFANPTYAKKCLGEAYGPSLSFLYTELRGAIAYGFEGRQDYLDILFELFLEIYGEFEMEEQPDPKNIQDILYWYASDYCDVFVADSIHAQLCPSDDFATKLIMESDLTDLRYLYRFGEYISENELLTAKHLLSLPEDVIQKMADVYTEGFRVGFINTGRDLSKKSVVNIRYVLGFERVVKAAILNFEKMGLSPVIYRSSVTVLTRRGYAKVGYYGGIAGKQYEYDHRNDQALFLDRRFLERKLSVIESTYKDLKKEAAELAGPACIETFGEEPFTPVPDENAIQLTEEQEALVVEYDSRQNQIVNTYVPGDERSFTIIAYPVPEIGEKYPEIFDEIVKINTLDAHTYEVVQETLIDALNQGEYVHVLGGNGNRTDLNVQLYHLEHPEKETIFENCVADVNIPVGEVFTSPVLQGTNGTLHVSRVYLNDLQYENLEIQFKDGMVDDYNCSNFSSETENKDYIRDTVLMKHPTLPMGEFAIGTNTTAYMVAKKYHIEDKMPILIAEKMGPHFALGDTCYSWSEDVRVYNPDGKEIVAKDNAISIKRKEDVGEAYFQCHTDITIPYEEIKSITVVKKDGTKTDLLRDGRFVLPGTEILNEPLDQ